MCDGMFCIPHMNPPVDEDKDLMGSLRDMESLPA